MKATGLALIVFLFSHLSFSATDLPVRDSDFACISKSKADQYNQDFNIDTNSFGGQELCNSAKDTKKLYNDLSLIESGSFTGSGTNNLIRGFIPYNQYYSWMKSATRGVSRGQDVPYATAYNQNGYFTMQDGWASLSTLGRVGTIVHEARHTQGYSHTACNQGPYLNAGVAGCDRDYSYGGSHAIEMEYYARVTVAGENFHPVYKKMARLMAMGRSNFVFNQTPLKQREALMILGQSGKSYLLQSGQWVQREAPAEKGLLKRTSFGAVVMTPQGPFAIDPYENSGLSWSVLDDFSYFKLLNSDRLKNQTVQDFEEIDLGRKRYVFVMTTQNQFTNFNFRGGSWNRFIANPGSGTSFFTTWTPDGQNGIYFVDQNSNIYSIDPERIQNSQTIPLSWPAEVKSFTKNSDGFFKLTTSNELFLQRSIGTQPVATPEPVEQMTSVPMYDAFEVKL